MCALLGVARGRQSIELVFDSGASKALARRGWHFHVSARSPSHRSPLTVSRVISSPLCFLALAGSLSSLSTMN